MKKTIHQAEPDPEEHDLCKRAFVLAIRDALNVVSGKWKLAIICTLLSGPKGFAEIERLLGGVTPRMLSRELRELEVNGAVARVSLADQGKTRKYALTPSGRGLEEVVFMLADWGRRHRELSSAAQAVEDQPLASRVED